MSGASAAAVGWVLLTDGVVAMLWVGAAGIFGSVLLGVCTGRAEVSGEHGTLRCVTSVAAGLGAFSLLALGLGLAGWLSRATALALPVGSVAVWVALFLRRHGNASLAPHLESAKAWLNAPAGWDWLWLIPMPLLAMAAIGATVPPVFLWKTVGDPHPFDVLEYHLQVPREWYELGRIVPLHHNVFSFFPFNQEMQYLLAMHIRGGPWAAMFLAQFLSLSFAALSVVAIYATIRALRPDRPGLATVGAAAAAVAPWVPMLGAVAYNESGLLLYGTLAIAWMLVAARDVRMSHVLLGGVMAGLACGTKYTAAPILLVALPFIALLLHWRASRIVPRLAIYLLVAIAVFSPWLIRTIAWAGNPVFPEAMPLLGRGHFTPQQVERWEAAHSPRDDQRDLVARLAAAKNEIAFDWRYGWVLWPLTIAAIVVGRRDRAVWMLAALLVALAIFWIGFTHLQSRFFAMGIPIAGLLIGLAPWPRRAGAALAIVLGAASVAGVIKLWPALSAGVEPVPGFRTPGFDDLSAFVPQEMQKYAEQGRRFVLVGDAAAYRYPIDTSRLRYRTVFDVVVSDRGIVESWQGGPLSPGEVPVISAQELVRARTYRGIPAYNPNVDDVPSDAIILQQPEQVR